MQHLIICYPCLFVASGEMSLVARSNKLNKTSMAYQSLVFVCMWVNISKVKSKLGDQSPKAVHQDFDQMGATGIMKLECITVLSGHENEVKCGAWRCLREYDSCTKFCAPQWSFSSASLLVFACLVVPTHWLFISHFPCITRSCICIERYSWFIHAKAPCSKFQDGLL